MKKLRLYMDEDYRVVHVLPDDPMYQPGDDDWSVDIEVSDEDYESVQQQLRQVAQIQGMLSDLYYKAREAQTADEEHATMDQRLNAGKEPPTP